MGGIRLPFFKKTKRSLGAVGLFLSKSSLRRIFRYFYFRIKPTTFVAAEVRGMDVLDAGPEQPYVTRDKNRQPKGGTKYMLQKKKL